MVFSGCGSSTPPPHPLPTTPVNAPGKSKNANNCKFDKKKKTNSCEYYQLLVLECSNYKVLNENERAKGYRGGIVKCDRTDRTGFVKAWYRFEGGAGDQMPDTCVPVNRCGTHAPGWLSDGHPAVAEGAASRKVCFHWSGNCCRWNMNVRVRNCGKFYVYELPPTQYCSLRYCGNKDQGR